MSFVFAMLYIRLTTQEYRASARSMDRHRRRFTTSRFCGTRPGPARHIFLSPGIVSLKHDIAMTRHVSRWSGLWNC